MQIDPKDMLKLAVPIMLIAIGAAFFLYFDESDPVPGFYYFPKLILKIIWYQLVLLSAINLLVYKSKF